MGIMSSRAVQENGNGLHAKHRKLYKSQVTVVLGKETGSYFTEWFSLNSALMVVAIKE